MRQMHPLNGVVKQSFALLLQDSLRGKWIGAITRQNAHLPEGRKFHGGELKKPEVKAAWEAVDTLAKKSICLRRTFQVGDRTEGEYKPPIGQENSRSNRIRLWFGIL